EVVARGVGRPGNLPIALGEEDRLPRPIRERRGELGLLPTGKRQAIERVAQPVVTVPRSTGLGGRVVRRQEDLRHGAVVDAGDVAPVGRRSLPAVGAVRIAIAGGTTASA